MGLILGRWLLAVLLMTLGALLGYLVGQAGAAPVLGTWIGASAGVLLALLGDAWRGLALMRWLRSNQASGAPRHRGFWGEIGYRVERALAFRDRALLIEQERLGEFLSAIEASPNGVLLLDADEQISWCNSVAADHFGLNRERDRGQRVTNLVRSPAFVSLFHGAPTDEPVSVVDHHTGRTLQVLLRAYAGDLKLVLTQDVTERLQAEAMRRDFVANVSHEIRTPLTVLAGFVETMVNLPLTESERQRVLSLMTQQAQRMQGLVSDLLTLAQLEGSPRPAADQWLGVGALLRQIEVEGRGLSQERHVLSFPDVAAIEAQGAQIAGSQSELLSALINLTSNAVRYTPEGGRIEVSWSNRADGQACFEVRDTGIGIGREHIPRLTQRFYRVDGSRSRETGGTGLGLSIVKHVVQRHGAELQIESEPGRGSLFRIVFPANRMRITADGGRYKSSRPDQPDAEPAPQSATPLAH